ncbi:enoyl-CoA hydratase/isomerase family protein [Burkholderia sp. BCC1977]|uniref:enoyl-CoA hydratase/isomerase family protein n=1 Tax=Burkholderia sp. BCC1977 TaxID=2817440 RepID=UPI002ABD8416|nr:enoyl-CoA hydratase/isomerase family protein [Burkholderia sp. BCC1977]
MTEKSAVLLEQRDRVFWITINRPSRRNVLNDDVVTGIVEGYRIAHSNPDVRAIVLTGAGDQAFCAGADLQPGRTFQFDFSEPHIAYANMLRMAADALLPCIVRVNGACLAGGMGLLCMGDLAVSADSAIFGLPEVKVGVFPMQVLSLLQDLVPQRVMREWCLTGEAFNASTALAHGLVNHVVPAADLDSATDALLCRLIDKSPSAIRRGKYTLRAISAMSFDQSIAFAESQIALVGQTEDAREGVAAFQEKRRPVWTGR